MTALKKLGYRIYQKLLFVGMFVMPWRKPKVLDSLEEIVEILKKHKKSNPLVVTDKPAMLRNALAPLLDSFAKNQTNFKIFDQVLPNPTIDQIEQGRQAYLDGQCDSIIAFGGGSVLDCAKVIGARISKPKKSVSKMKGLLKIRKKLPLFFAIPTTAGTGSETTVAAVVTDATTHEKYGISDFSLIPHYAVLDAKLTVDLPPNLTATTAMDALTHAVEAFIGKANTCATKKQAKQAVKLIFENLKQAFDDGTDLTARKNLQKAAFLAGLAFTRAYVGYVHALAHALGGSYGVPHGLANSILLPIVLLAYGKSADKKLAMLADEIGLTGENYHQKALAFVQEIQTLMEKTNIPATLPTQFNIQHTSLEAMAKTASKEANPLYPVPKILDVEDFVAIFQEAL